LGVLVIEAGAYAELPPSKYFAPNFWWHGLSSLCLDSRGRLSSISSETFQGNGA
jgi:hypothetical protein